MGHDIDRKDTLHDLRVLVSSVRVSLDELAVLPGEGEASREALRDQVDLLAEILRVMAMVEHEDEDGVDVVDARTLIWFARSRHPDVFMGRMPSPVWVRTNVSAALELVDVVVEWVAASAGRVRLVAVPRPAALFVVGAPENDRANQQVSQDREMEQTILSLAGAARVEACLRHDPRSARLELVSAELVE